MSKPVCLITGVGPAKGTGAEVAKRFAEGGYQVAMLARNKDNLSDCERTNGTSSVSEADTYICKKIHKFLHFHISHSA